MNTVKRIFAIVNIVMGVVITLSSFAMFGNPQMGPGGIICLLLGGLLWGVGAWMLSTLKNDEEDEEKVKKVGRWNMVCFALSCLVLAGAILAMFA